MTNFEIFQRKIIYCGIEVLVEVILFVLFSKRIFNRTGISVPAVGLVMLEPVKIALFLWVVTVHATILYYGMDIAGLTGAIG